MTSTSWTPVAGALRAHPDKSVSLSTLLCDALAADIAERTLLPGDELPTQRFLARRLGVSLGTVHRAYREAADRGLIRGEVGRGSFVLEARASRRLSRLALEQPAGGPNTLPIDLSRNLALPNSLPTDLQRRVRDLVRSVSVDDYTARGVAGGDDAACDAGSLWAKAPIGTRTLLVGGAQLGLNAIISSFTKPGDTIIADSLSFPGLRLAAAQQHVSIVTIPGQPGRPDPAAVAATLRKHKSPMWFCIPTLHNPTTAVMSPADRSEMATVANRYGTYVIEDDVYGFLISAKLPSLAEKCERGIRLISLAKSTLAGLRVAYINSRPEIADTIRDAIEALCWMTAPPAVAMATNLITTGVASDIAAWKRDELADRLVLARSIVGRRLHCDAAASLHVWVNLPEHWNTSSFTAACAEGDVLVAPADEFSMTTRMASPNNVRISLGGPSIEELTRALQFIKKTMSSRTRR
jgi:DNA-binding transcriptional MocR family regulator